MAKAHSRARMSAIVQRHASFFHVARQQPGASRLASVVLVISLLVLSTWVFRRDTTTRSWRCQSPTPTLSSARMQLPPSCSIDVKLSDRSSSCASITAELNQSCRFYKKNARHWKNGAALYDPHASVAFFVPAVENAAGQPGAPMPQEVGGQAPAVIATHNLVEALAAMRQADKLMIVAHPDDEIIFGGRLLLADAAAAAATADGAASSPSQQNQSRSSGWMVVFCTQDFSRGNMVSQMVSRWHLAGAIILGHADSPLLQVVDERLVADLSSIIASRRWSQVVTHSAGGEYGHKQHIVLHKLVSTVLAKAAACGQPLADSFVVFKLQKLPRNDQTAEEMATALEVVYKRRRQDWPQLFKTGSEDAQVREYDTSSELTCANSPPAC